MADDPKEKLHAAGSEGEDKHLQVSQVSTKSYDEHMRSDDGSKRDEDSLAQAMNFAFGS